MKHWKSCRILPFRTPCKTITPVTLILFFFCMLHFFAPPLFLTWAIWLPQRVCWNLNVCTGCCLDIVFFSQNSQKFDTSHVLSFNLRIYLAHIQGVQPVLSTASHYFVNQKVFKRSDKRFNLSTHLTNTQWQPIVLAWGKGKLFKLSFLQKHICMYVCM